MPINDRTQIMVQLYGECCTRKTAAHILSCCPAKIRRLLKDGVIHAACAGQMVDVRSIAIYLQSPAEADEAARIRKLKLKHNTEFAV